MLDCYNPIYYYPINNSSEGSKEKPSRLERDLTTQPFPGGSNIGKSAEERLYKFVEDQRIRNMRALEKFRKQYFF